MDDNDFSGNPLAVYPKFTPAKFTELKLKKHPLAGLRFAEGGRMQDPLMAVKPNPNPTKELVIVETPVVNEPETVADAVNVEPVAAEVSAATKSKPKRSKPLWPEIVKLLRQHPDGLGSDDIASALGEKRQAVVSALGKARRFQPDSLSLVDGRWTLKRMPAGMEDDWEVSKAVGRIFTPPEPALPEFDQAAEFVAAVREIGRRVMGTDERLALLLQMGAEWVEQVAAAK